MAYPDIKADRSERVLYDRADYPAYIRKGKLSAYPNYAAESHWHDDIELILILSGQMQYNINGEIILLKQGEGVFVNAKQLHFGFSEEKSECEFICILLHPILLCSSKTAEEKYISPILFNEQIPFCHLKDNSKWKKDILSATQEIYAVKNDALSELKIQRAFLSIWILLCENAVSMRREQTQKGHQLSALKDMVSFINRNYAEKLSLGDIASAGKVGKTGCCEIFRKYLNQTPNEYLTRLRLRKAGELLASGDITVTQAAYEVGFSGASYFTEIFHKFYGCTPSEYRKALGSRN